MNEYRQNYLSNEYGVSADLDYSFVVMKSDIIRTVRRSVQRSLPEVIVMAGDTGRWKQSRLQLPRPVTSSTDELLTH